MVQDYIRVKHLFHWEGLEKAVKALVAECDICQKEKYDQRDPMGLLQQMLIPHRILEDLTIGVICQWRT